MSGAEFSAEDEEFVAYGEIIQAALDKDFKKLDDLAASMTKHERVRLYHACLYVQEAIYKAGW